MKPYLFLLFFGASASVLPAQTLLQDAMVLRAFFDTTDAEDFDKRLIFNGGEYQVSELQVFQKYVPQKGVLTTAGVEDAFRGNPFVRVEITDQNALNFTGNLSASGLNKPSLSTMMGPRTGSGISVSGIADGLARFLVNRTKQELSQAFFDDFKEALNKEPLLGYFCPATKAQLDYVDQGVYQFNDYLEGLRETFTLDMTALPGNMEGYLRDYYADKEAGVVAIDLLHLSQQMVDGEAPIDMLDYLARSGSAIQNAEVTQPVLYDMAGGFRFINLVSESLIRPNIEDPTQPAQWFTSRELRNLFADPLLFHLYMGLLWQKSEGVSFVGKDGTPKQNMRDILFTAAQSADLLNEWRNTIQGIGESVHNLQNTVHASARAGQEAIQQAKSSVPDDFFRYSLALTDVLQTLNRSGKLILQRDNDLIPSEYISLFRQCNFLYFNVRQRNYTGAISNVIFCLNVLGKDKAEVQRLLKYANFVACVAEANSPEEVERAIELFALPPGSSRMKKQPKRFSVALNAYTGLAVGSEWMANETAPKTIAALAAPIGLSCSWGLKKGSIGFFVPLIDVGAVTAFRFKDNNYQNLPELTWNNLLAPGFYAVYNFPGKWPIALGVGGQAGPALRKVSDAGLTISDAGGARIGGFLAVDIPITYFYLGKGKDGKKKPPGRE